MLFWIFVIAAGVVVGGLVFADLNRIVFAVLLVVSASIVALLLVLVVPSLAQVSVPLTVLLMIAIIGRYGLTHRREAPPPVSVEDRPMVPNAADESHPSRPQREQRGPSEVGAVLHMAIDQVSRPLDAQTTRTIIEALAFYRDNCLAYGKMPAQLDAQETTALIASLALPNEG